MTEKLDFRVRGEITSEDLLAALESIDRRLTTFVGYFIKAETEIPQYLQRYTMHYHDLVSIKWALEQIGQQMDPVLSAELERTHERLKEVIESEITQGGAFHEHIGRMKREGKLRRDK